MTQQREQHQFVDLRSATIGAGTAAVVLGLVVALGVAYSPERATAQVGTQVLAAGTLGSVAAVAQAVGPAVVSVRTDQGPAPGSGMIYDPSGLVLTNQGLGSGVIYDASGLILSNAHVLQGAQSITVALADGRHFAASVVGADTGFDVAVLRIHGSNLPTAPLGDSAELQVGDEVVSIGNPYGFDHTLTTGVVSALNRAVSEGEGSYNQPMIQTDAAINPGNSGGPLLDINGQVIGITTLVASPQGVPAFGLGFAVPVDTAKRVADQLVSSGKVTHSGQPYLGLALTDINAAPGPTSGGTGSSSGGRQGQQAAPAPPRGVDHGALVTDVESGGPAAAAGLKTGDVIVNIDGFDVYDPDELSQRLVLHKPGDQAHMNVVRNGQQSTVGVTIGEAPVSTD
jgi:S1-C subfamily serine protease